MRRFRIVVCVLLCILMLASCAPSAKSPEPTPVPIQSTALPAPTEVAAAVPEGALFEVIKQDGSRVPVTIEQLKQLPLAQLMAEGKVEEGPRLSDVLALAGIGEYNSVKISGSSNPATLTREQVEADAILDFTNHGTVKLSTQAIPKAEWTKDISLIEVQ